MFRRRSAHSPQDTRRGLQTTEVRFSPSSEVTESRGTTTWPSGRSAIWQCSAKSQAIFLRRERPNTSAFSESRRRVGFRGNPFCAFLSRTAWTLTCSRNRSAENHNSIIRLQKTKGFLLSFQPLQSLEWTTEACDLQAVGGHANPKPPRRQNWGQNKLFPHSGVGP